MADTRASEKRGWVFPALLTVLAAGLFALRLSAPSNLLDQDQERPGTYVLDVLKNAHWLCQHDLTGDVTSKPPLWTWVSAAGSLAWGKADRFTLYLPGALGAWGTALLVFYAGRKRLGNWAGFWAGVAVMVCTAGLKEFGLARTDGVFAFTVTACALCAFEAWTAVEGRQRRWFNFWACAALATLAKGPLGVVLGVAGLAAVRWERKSGAPLPLRGSQVAGVAFFILVTGGWFALAYRECGVALWHKMIGRELVGHMATSSSHSNFPGKLFYQPTLYYLGRGAPWSLLAFYGLWRVWKRPAAEVRERRFERFLFCWFAVGLILFSLAPHQRGDLLWPIMPAAALLAGRELQSWSTRAGRKVGYITGTVAVLMIAGFAIYYFRIQPRLAINRQTSDLERMASHLKQFEGEFPLTYVDAPMGLQIMLNTWHPAISYEQAAQLLREEEPVYLAVRELSKLKLAGATNSALSHVLLSSDAGRSTLVVSNQRQLSSPAAFVLACGSLVIRAERARLVNAGESEFRFVATEPMAEVSFTNDSGEPRRITVSFDNRPLKPQQHEFMPGEIWRLAVP